MPRVLALILNALVFTGNTATAVQLQDDDCQFTQSSEATVFMQHDRQLSQSPVANAHTSPATPKKQDGNKKDLFEGLKDSALSMMSHPPRGVPWWWNPWAIFLANLLVFGALRLSLGGSNYLTSKAWYALCFIIPVSVAIGIVSGALCIPLRLDGPTFLHLAAALVYMQLDLWLSRWLCGAEVFGTANVLAMIAAKFRLQPALGDGGLPPIARCGIEFNGALLHEIFWNVCICQNFIDWGWSPIFAIAAVPVISCALHAVTSNTMQGIRCAPQFCWVALAYHASGSVLPPGFIHAMWYMADGRLLVILGTFKRDWDFDKRKDESTTPPPHMPFFLGWLLILCFYGSLNVLTAKFPELRSVDRHVALCKFGAWPSNPVELIILGGFCAQLVGGIATWNYVRAAMDILAAIGDGTTNGLVRTDHAMRKYIGMPLKFEEDPALPAYMAPAVEDD